MVRLESSTPPLAPVWSPLDRVRLPFAAASSHEPALTAPLGYTAVMVITHDCQMDKAAEAENHPELDRFVTVAPSVPVSWLRTDNDKLLSGEVTGYYPVLTWPERGIAGGVADLTFPSTIDRKLLIQRMASLTDQARDRLRLSLARLYACRSPEVGFEVEAAIGRRILDARRVVLRDLLRTSD